MEILSSTLVFLLVVAPAAVGALVMLFNRRVSLQSLRLRQSALNIGFSEREVRVGQFLAVAIGALLLISGVLGVVEVLSAQR
jgi:hypothetical protein